MLSVQNLPVKCNRKKIHENVHMLKMHLNSGKTIEMFCSCMGAVGKFI